MYQLLVPFIYGLYRLSPLAGEKDVLKFEFFIYSHSQIFIFLFKKPVISVSVEKMQVHSSIILVYFIHRNEVLPNPRDYKEKRENNKIKLVESMN